MYNRPLLSRLVAKQGMATREPSALEDVSLVHSSFISHEELFASLMPACCTHKGVVVISQFLNFVFSIYA